MRKSLIKSSENCKKCADLPDKLVDDKDSLPQSVEKLITIFWHSFYGEYRIEFISCFKVCPSCGRYYYVFYERDLNNDHDYDAVFKLKPVHLDLIGSLLDKAKKNNINANLTKAEDNPDKQLGEALALISMYFHDEEYNIYKELSVGLVKNAVFKFTTKKPKNKYAKHLAKILNN